MIRSLRTRHRWIFVVLALVVGFLLIAALSARRPAPTMDSLNFLDETGRHERPSGGSTPRSGDPAS